MARDEGRANVNVLQLTMWHMTADSETGTEYEDTKHTFPDQLNSFSYQPSMQIATQYGDGKKVEDYAVKDGGTCNAVIRAFADGDEMFLFGESSLSSPSGDGTGKLYTTVSNNKDIVPYCCVAYATRRSDGLYNLYKFPRVKWLSQGETNNQQEGTTIQFGTASLSGNYSPLQSNGDDKYKVIGVDAVKDKEFWDNWFDDPKFIQTQTV